MSFYKMLLLMALVTAGPRVFSVLLYEHFNFPPWTKRWLQSIPYAVLGALIFPGVLEVVPGSPMIGLLGGLVAVLLAYKKVNVMLIIVCSILVVFLMGSIF